MTLGALVADVPHTRPSPVTGAATDPHLVDELGLQLSRYEGPTGIVGVLLDSCRRAGIPSVSLWAAVPHYVQLAPSPPAAKALCERLGGVLSTDIDVSELEEASDEYVDQVSQAVATDTETAGYVEELERRADSLELLEDSADLPSGEALAQEIARFLREREDDGEDAGVRRPRIGGSAKRRLPRTRRARLVRRLGPRERNRVGRQSPQRAVGRERLGRRGVPFRFRRRRRDFRAVSFGAGRLSARAFAISSIVPSSSRAWSSAAFARGV